MFPYVPSASLDVDVEIRILLWDSRTMRHKRKPGDGNRLRNKRNEDRYMYAMPRKYYAIFGKLDEKRFYSQPSANVMKITFSDEEILTARGNGIEQHVRS